MFSVGIQKSTNFYVLCDLNMFISSKSFLKEFLCLLGTELYYSQIGIFQLFPCLGASSLCLILATLNKTGEIGCLCLAPDFSRNTLIPPLFNFGYRFVKYGIYYVMTCSFYSYVLQDFVKKRCVLFRVSVAENRHSNSYKESI